jgi:hypothetical protein
VTAADVRFTLAHRATLEAPANAAAARGRRVEVSVAFPTKRGKLKGGHATCGAEGYRGRALRPLVSGLEEDGEGGRESV